MNQYLEVACGWFGARSCETASGAQIMVMIFVATFAGLGVAWAVSKARANA